MKEQEKRDLMLKAAVQFKGVWPDPEFSDSLYLWPDGGFSVGLSCEETTFVCNRTEYEAFIESLFESAPDDVTHHGGTLEYPHWYKRINGAWCFNDKSDSRWHVALSFGQGFQKESDLIPRPRKQEGKIDVDGLYNASVDGIKTAIETGTIPSFSQASEWSGEGLPLVGMVCEYAHKKNDAWTKCKVNYVSNDKNSFIAADCHLSGGITDEQVLWSFEYKFRPLKTEAEKEREELINIASEIAYGGLYSNEANVSLEKRSKSIAESFVDAGWRPQE